MILPIYRFIVTAGFYPAVKIFDLFTMKLYHYILQFD